MLRRIIEMSYSYSAISIYINNSMILVWYMFAVTTFNIMIRIISKLFLKLKWFYNALLETFEWLPTPYKATKVACLYILPRMTVQR